jgi:hypothetical protein
MSTFLWTVYCVPWSATCFRGSASCHRLKYQRPLSSNACAVRSITTPMKRREGHCNHAARSCVMRFCGAAPGRTSLLTFTAQSSWLIPPSRDCRVRSNGSSLSCLCHDNISRCLMKFYPIPGAKKDPMGPFTGQVAIWPNWSILRLRSEFLERRNAPIPPGPHSGGKSPSHYHRGSAY